LTRKWTGCYGLYRSKKNRLSAFLFAEVERDPISARTKGGLAAARATGQLLGRPEGSLGSSKLDGKEGEIRMLLGKEVSKASIAEIVGVARTALHHFIRTRKLDPKHSDGRTRGRRR
jgi:DNA invertase Pin-like site-specific DNA recombinase